MLGASADGERRLLFDAADTPNGQSLEEVLRSTWNDTIEPGQPRPPTTVNGLPVVTALSNGKEWSFRLSAIRIGNTTYPPDHGHARGNRRISKGSSSDPQQRPAGSAGRSAADPAAASSQIVTAAARRHRRKPSPPGWRWTGPSSASCCSTGSIATHPGQVGERYKIVVE